MSEKRTIYFGPPREMYTRDRFKQFVEENVALHLKAIRSPSPCNPEHHNPEEVTYHFPEAGLGIRYTAVNEHRCMVDLLGTRKKVLDDITAFMFEADNTY